MLLKRLSLFFSIMLLSAFISHVNAVEPMPEWQLKNSKGDIVQSSDYQGKPLVIHFWATWCPYCKKLQPGLEKLKQKYQKQGVEFIAISFWEDEGASPQTVLDDRGISIPTLVDGDHVARELFGVEGTPTTVFVDRSGGIVGLTRTSNPDDPRLEQATQYLLSSSAK